MTSSFIRYTALRIALFGACLSIAALVGWWSLEGVVAAIVVSAVLSWFVLRAPREELARDLETRIETRGSAGGSTRKASRWDVDAAVEDAEADAHR